MDFRIIFSLLMFAACSMAAGEPTGGCGFGYEMLLAKLESIEERLIALEAKLANVPAQKVEAEKLRTIPKEESVARSKVDIVLSTTVPTELHGKADPTPKYPVGITPTEEQLAAGEENIYSSCREVPSQVGGKFLIRIGKNAQPINLLCDMSAIGSGWIVVQNRFNGSESFYRNWHDYEAGFGNLDGEFWLGLERISTLVNNGQQWEIMFWLRNVQGLMQYSKFNKFRLGNASELYVLKQIGSYSGNAGDSMTRHVGNKFTTYDRDNDPVAYNCAKKHRGGWWYHNTCIASNLNGLYGSTMSDQAMSWPTMKYSVVALQATKIMIREL